jgi:hypothetical protein
MAGNAADLHDAIARALATVPGLRVADHLPEAVTPPMAVIQIQSVTYHRAMQGGLSEWKYVISLVAGRMGDRAAQRTLDSWMSWDGAQSVRAAIEADRTLDGECSTLIIEDMITIRPLQLVMLNISPVSSIYPFTHDKECSHGHLQNRWLTQCGGSRTGSIITSGDLTGVDIQHLIDAGHIEPTSKGRKAEPNNNQED